MFHQPTKSRRHRRVIHEDGSPAESTVRMPRLRMALGLPVEREPQPEATVPLPVLAVQSERGSRTLGMQVPEAPQPPVRVFPSNFMADAVFLDQITVLTMRAHAAWHEMVRVTDRRMAALDEGLGVLGARVRGWTLELMDWDMAVAYAEGGTERVLRLTPEVLARLDAMKAGASA